MRERLVPEKYVQLFLPHTDGRADGKGEEGSPRVDAVCRRHRVVRRQGCGHDRVGDQRTGYMGCRALWEIVVSAE